MNQILIQGSVFKHPAFGYVEYLGCDYPVIMRQGYDFMPIDSTSDNLITLSGFDLLLLEKITEN